MTRRYVVEPRQMILVQLSQPLMQPAKQQTVRRQHQCIRRQRFEPRQRIEVFLFIGLASGCADGTITDGVICDRI